MVRFQLDVGRLVVDWGGVMVVCGREQLVLGWGDAGGGFLGGAAFEADTLSILRTHHAYRLLIPLFDLLLQPYYLTFLPRPTAQCHLPRLHTVLMSLRLHYAWLGGAAFVVVLQGLHF